MCFSMHVDYSSFHIRFQLSIRVFAYKCILIVFLLFMGYIGFFVHLFWGFKSCLIIFQVRKISCFNVRELNNSNLYWMLLNLIDALCWIEWYDLLIEFSFDLCMIEKIEELSNCTNWYDFNVYKLCWTISMKKEY